MNISFAYGKFKIVNKFKITAVIQNKLLKLQNVYVKYRFQIGWVAVAGGYQLCILRRDIRSAELPPHYFAFKTTT